LVTDDRAATGCPHPIARLLGPGHTIAWLFTLLRPQRL
jgi:hypothetical protein